MHSNHQVKLRGRCVSGVWSPLSCLLATERSERDTIRVVQIQAGAVCICMEVCVP